MCFIMLFQVDIVFEEDKGFWAAIQTFMSSTKRPIIMTTNDAHFTERFEGTFEQLMFKRPSAVSTFILFILSAILSSSIV